MSWTVLTHDPRLGVSPGPAGPPVAPPAAGTRVLSFRPPPAGRPHDVRGGLNAMHRLLDLKADHLTCVALETDSSLAPLHLWDIAHTLPVGGTVTMLGDAVAPYLGRSYFTAGLKVAKKDASGVTFEKFAELPAELDRGLDRWSFGIPTGGGDAGGLNTVVKRILELGIPEMEVILCGRPGANFRYWDRVKIVGEDLNRLPVPIAAKKNRLVEHAQYENLCLIHDRVFLPKDFYAGMKKHGDLYPVTGYQSLWFDDQWNLVGKRYSDYCRQLNSGPLGALSQDPTAADVYKPGLLAEMERGGFISCNALRYNQGNYCTGSLYVCKRRVWQACPQDPRLCWQQMEDVDHGLRCNLAGIPHRVNPHGFTQSIYTRPQLLCRGLLHEAPDGRLVTSTNLLEEVWFQRKPMTRISVDEAHRRMLAFAERWMPKLALDIHRAELSARPTNAAIWVRQASIIVYAAAVGYSAEHTERFLADYEKSLIFDTYSDFFRNLLIELFGVHGPMFKDHLAEHAMVLGNMMLFRRRGNLFYESMSEYFPERSRWERFGTWFSAWRMARHGGLIFNHPGGAAEFRTAIQNCTPYREYLEE